MRRMLVLGVVVAICSSVPATAQEGWTPEQRAVWMAIEAQHEAWHNRDADGWLAERHADCAAWGDGLDVPVVGLKQLKKRVDFGFTAREILFSDITPAVNSVYGDAAVVMYHGIAATKEPDGSRITIQGGNTMFLIREDGKWRIIGSHWMSTQDD